MTNHNPTISSSNATGSFSENANTTGSNALHNLSGTMNFTDSDHSDTHTVSASLKSKTLSSGSVIPATSLAHLTSAMSSSILTDSNGSGKLKWAFSAEDDDFDFLSKNQTLTLTYEVKLKDNHGGSTTKLVTITITGTDDKPIIDFGTQAMVNEQANKTLSFSLDTVNIAVHFTDVDLTNTGHTATVIDVSASGTTGGILPGALGEAELMSFFDINNVVKASGSSNGTINTTFSAPDLAFDYLGAGETVDITYTIKLDDHAGGISNQTVVVTVVGSNDRPTVLAFPESEHLTEDHNLSGGNLTAQGDFWFSDLDLSDTHTVSTTVTATRSGGGTIPISNADLIDAMGAIIDPDSTSQLLGEVDWNFALPNSAVDFLAEGETLTLKYQITVTDPYGASDTQEVCITVLGINKPVVTKTATVPGGTANVAGEVISYDIAVANAGHTTLTGITVTDPSVSNLAPVLSGGFNAGDTNHDNQLSAGETWQYTASYTVTQADINSDGGGDGAIENTVSVDSDQALPVSATASVTVEQGISIDLVKTANVSSADAAGDVINYTINITNTGTVNLTDPIVTDSDVNIVTPILDFGAPILGPELLSPVYNGDYNVGDTNENGIEDPGETFQFHNVGDENNNGIEDPGETFVLTNVGDTNQNGTQDTGEVFQYYNAGDTNQNGVEDPGETFQFNVSHQVAGVDANHDGFNDGDANADGILNVGETWQYAVSYTVTQADIDNGGVVDPSLTHDDTAAVSTSQAATDEETVSVSLVQNPHLTLVKSATVPGGTVDVAGEVISYTITVTNDGNMTLTNPVVSDPSVSNLAAVLSGGFNAGDADHDGKLDLGETWQYTANHTVTQSDIDNGGVVNPALTYSNTASVTTDQGASDADANDSDTASVPIAQNPHLTLVKAATVPGGTADAAGEVISYAITVTNDGNMTLTNPVVSDPSVSNLAAVLSGGFNAGDADHDGKLDLGEAWQYTASHTVTQAELDAGGSITNTASVTTDQGASDADANDSDTASVTIVQNPSVTLDKAASVPGGTADTAGEVISYTIAVTNNGNVSLTSVAVSDPSVADLAAVMSGTFNVGDLNADGSLSVGETWQYTASHTVTQSDLDTNGGGDGTIDNTASVTTAQGASANDSASVTVVQPLTVGISIDDNNHLSQLSDPGGDGPTVGDPIQFFFQITNLGNTMLTNVAVSDTLGDAVPGSLQTPVPTTLAGNAVFGDTFNHFLTAADISAGHVVDDITVMALDYLSATQTATYHYDFFLP